MHIRQDAPPCTDSPTIVHRIVHSHFHPFPLKTPRFVGQKKFKHMTEKQQTLTDEIRNLNLRLARVEEYIRRQIALDPVTMPPMNTTIDEDSFALRFRRMHPGFVPRLRELVPAITPAEERLCIMIKLNMTVREIARMLNNDIKSVHTARARLKRKLPLDADTTMDQWIKKIDN